MLTRQKLLGPSVYELDTSSSGVLSALDRKNTGEFGLCGWQMVGSEVDADGFRVFATNFSPL